MENKLDDLQKERTEAQRVVREPDTNSDTEKRRNHIIQINDLISQCGEGAKIPFIWNGIPKGSFGYIFGPAKSGKTILCENLGLSLAADNASFFGYDLIQGDNSVLFISLEEFWQPRTERNSKQIKSMKLEPEEKLNYYVVDGEFPRHFSSTRDRAILNETISDSSANVVFIDSLTRMINGEIENSTLCRNASIRLKEIAAEREITLIVIHHTPKQAGKPITIESLAGSRVLGQEADFMIGINRGTTGIRYFKEVGFRYKQEDDEQVVMFDINDNLWINPTGKIEEYKLLQEPDRRNDDSNYITVLNIIRINAAMNKGIINSSEVEKIAVETMSRSTFYEHINRMLKKGILHQESKGKYIYNSSDI